MTGRWAPWVLLIIIGTTLPACGGDSDDEEDAKSGATLQCELFASTWCNRAVGCLVMLGTLTEADRSENLEVCIDVAIAAAQCEDAISVGDSYDQCLAETEAKPCSDWDVPESELSTVTPPSSCTGVITVR